MDSAFCRDQQPLLIKLAQVHLELGSNAEEIFMLRLATAARSSTEWGTQTFQLSSCRLKGQLP